MGMNLHCIHHRAGHGNEPIAIAAADLNGDGIPDLMVPSYTADTMSVWLTQLQQSAQAVLTKAAPQGQAPTTWKRVIRPPPR